MSRRRYRARNRTVGTLETVLAAALLAGALVCAVSVPGLLSRVQFGPPVGEILTFGADDQQRLAWHVDATQSATNRRCILRPAVMATTEASMVVERRLADGRTFLVHWAGGPTSRDAGNCGSDVDLRLGLAAMQTLVSAAGKTMHWEFVGP